MALGGANIDWSQVAGGPSLAQQRAANQAAIMANPSQIAGGDLTPLQMEQGRAQRVGASVTAGAPVAPVGPAEGTNLGPVARTMERPSSTIVNPKTGQLMGSAGRDKDGNLISGGFSTPFDRVNLDPQSQRLMQAGDIQMQRGLGGATLAGLPMVDAERMRAAQIDRTGFDRATVAQDALAGRGNRAIAGLESAAAGNVPSVAAIQQQQGIEQAQQAAMATAASARGGADARAAAMRQGVNQGAMIAQQGVNQAAQLRAAEMAQARGDLVGAIGQQQQLAQGMGGLQAQLAGQQAGLTQQGRLANQSAELQAALARQQGYLGATGMDQGMVGQGGSMLGQGAQLGVAGTAFNNQQAQADMDVQNRMYEQYLAKYGIDKGVALQRDVANQQANAAMMGAALNAAGSLGGAAINYFGK